MTKSFGAALMAALALGVAGTAAISTASCSQTPVNVPVRTFERAQRMDVVCMEVRDLAGNKIPPVPVEQSKCAPVAPDQDGTYLQYHLYALVTQTTRGEVAIVDLTSAAVIDIDQSTPGINFVPVGSIPTDLAVTPDGTRTFVASAAVNRPAIYAIANSQILGDSQPGVNGTTPQIPSISSWPACALPQAPSQIVLVPRAVPAVVTAADAGDAASDAEATDAGAADANATDADATDAGATDAGAGEAGEAGVTADGGAAPAPDYVITVVLPGDQSSSAKVVTIDPTKLVAGAAGGFAPGALPACPYIDGVELGNPPSTATSAFWSDGIPFAGGGNDLTNDHPPSAGCFAASSDGGPSDAGSSGSDAASDAGSLLPPPKPHASSAALDTSAARVTLYVGDDALPLIHAIDVTDPTRPTELAPLRVSSVAEPLRQVAVSAIAISPPTRDFQRFLYAIDQKDGSLMVFDITDPVKSPKGPLRRPHPELNPFQPPDRIIFSVPAAAVAFVRHDFALTKTIDSALRAARTGILCNPNPAVNAPGGTEQGPFTPGDLGNGGYYRADVSNLPVGLGPARLRGIFAFVTLSNGQMVTIDVDDWDAPCRRPDPFDQPPNALAPPEPAAGANDLDPYHVPFAVPLDNDKTKFYSTSPVSLESFFPVSAPHRPRSSFVLRNDPSAGNHSPYLTGLPQLFNGTAPLPVTGPEAIGNPVMLAPATTIADPSLYAKPTETNLSARGQLIDPPYVIDANSTLPYKGFPDTNSTFDPSLRFSYEDPQVHIDQDWSITYEGVLPNFDARVAAQVTTTDNYQTAILSQPQALFCRRGVEDFALGTARANAEIQALQDAKLPVPGRLDHRTGDYVQVIDDLLAEDDPYWAAESDGQACWDNEKDPAARYKECSDQFGTTLDPAAPSLWRDFPILQAYDDKLVISRFGYPAGSGLSIATREVQPASESRNPGFLKRLQCCFHSQVHFRVRTGAQWLAFGAAVGYLHHIKADPATGMCVQDCEPRKSLLNARAPALARPTDVIGATALYRNSAVALRNPVFSVLMWNGVDTVAQVSKIPDRDMIWKFSTRGQFVPIIISITGTTTSVSPQSMRFIDSLGQLALVDGASQGLVLIDLDAVAIARSPYF